MALHQDKSTRAYARGNSGFSVIEILLAAALFVIIAGGVIEVTLQGLQNNRGAQEQTQASQFLSEGFEAVRSIKQQGYANIINSAGTGVVISGGIWTFAGTNNTFGKFTRTITVGDVNRDGSGNIVASGGTLDPQTKKITITVTWNAIDAVHQNTISQTQYLTNWKKRGVLVYGDGGTTTDAMKFQIFDPDKDTWSTAALVADVDTGTTNKSARAVKLYSSPTRNEKILVSRHFDGTNQFIYAQVYNGSTWGNVQLLSTIPETTFLDVQNFDGSYQANGNFMVIFSDDTTVPKMRTWNGTAWSTQSSLTDLGPGNRIPLYIVSKVRDKTNEVMAVFFTRNTQTISQYFNGTTWSAIITHSGAAPANNQRLIDFDWSPNSALIGGLVFSTSGTDRALHIKIWTADGAGSGTWSATANTANQGTGSTRLGAMAIVGRPGANIFEACNANTVPQIICYESNFTPTWTNPTNQIIAATTVGGIQRPFHLGFQTVSGNPAIAVYTDNTAVPKFKKYTANTTTWDAAATNITTSGSPGVWQTFRTIPNPYSDDIMVLLADANFDLFSIIWDGTNTAMYAAPAARAYTAHGTNGSATTDYWYDFSWDN